MNRLLAALCGACAVLACASAAAQPYPGRPVKMLVGYAAGGGADALA
ncbi:MAG: tripartite tricarboxylate transporter substrate binding protein, partial [Burkholderiales bacterium]|nr:tripartite tricarboxylate transporter substrate binding protein [Burkholderiales bacterium]